MTNSKKDVLKQRAYLRLERLNKNMFEYRNKYKSVNLDYKSIILNVVKINLKDIEIINNLFVFNTLFYHNIIDYIKLNYKHIHERKHEVGLDNALYTITTRMMREDIIHSKSSFFPKSRRLISINPNPFSLLQCDFKGVDLFMAQIALIQKNGINNFLYLYIYLRIYHYKTFYPNQLRYIQFKDIIVLSEEKTLLIINHSDEKKVKTLYKTVVLDSCVSHFLFNAFDNNVYNAQENVFLDSYESNFQKYKAKTFGSLSLHSLRYANENYYTFTCNRLEVTLRAKKIPSVQLSLKEVERLYPDKVPSEYLDIENEYIKTLLENNTEDENTISNYEVTNNFELHHTIALSNLLKYNKILNFEGSKKGNNTVIAPPHMITRALKEMQAYLERSTTESNKLIFKYLIYELLRLDREEIALSTFRNYIYTINKHLFSMVHSVDDIKKYEIGRMQDRLEESSAAQNTLNAINNAYKRFFEFIKSDQTIEIEIPALMYPKSMILTSELDDVLFYLQKKNQKYIQQRKTYISTFKSLQDQAIVLFAFYSGLRKSELYTLHLKDVYFANNKFVIYVIGDGMKKFGMKLKTKAAKRRVHLHIDNQIHLSILKTWYSARKEVYELKNRCPYLFLDYNEKKIFSRIMNQEKFAEYAYLLRKVTKRYVTFHSLRHSFATYSVLRILNSNTAAPYSFLELSMQMGHQTPEVTVNKYVHFDLIQLLRDEH